MTTSFSWADGTEVTVNWDPTADNFGAWRTETSYVITDPDGIVLSEDYGCTFQRRNQAIFV